MKKVITLLGVAIIMLVFAQNVTAQNNKLDINAIAAEKTELLVKQLKLDKKQQEQVYEVYQIIITKKSNMRESSTTSASLDKLNSYRDEKLKSILSESQFERYLQIKEE